MPRRNRLEQCLSALLVLGMVVGTSGLANAEPSSRLAKFDQEAGEIHFALSVKLDPASVPVAQRAEVGFLIDTSASQAGIYREDSFAALQSALSTLPPATRVLVMAGDLHAVSMQDGFAPPRDPKVAASLSKLQQRTPLGSTDLPAILITADRSPRIREEAHSKDVAVLYKPLKATALRALIAQPPAQRVAAE
jgi:hypothetical protein